MNDKKEKSNESLLQEIITKLNIDNINSAKNFYDINNAKNSYDISNAKNSDNVDDAKNFQDSFQFSERDIKFKNIRYPTDVLRIILSFLGYRIYSIEGDEIKYRDVVDIIDISRDKYLKQIYSSSCWRSLVSLPCDLFYDGNSSDDSDSSDGDDENKNDGDNENDNDGDNENDNDNNDDENKYSNNNAGGNKLKLLTDENFIFMHNENITLLYSYDLKTKSWDKLPKPPASKLYHRSFGKIITVNNKTIISCFDNIRILSKNNKWSKISQLNHGHFSLAFVVIGNYILEIKYFVSNVTNLTFFNLSTHIRKETYITAKFDSDAFIIHIFASEPKILKGCKECKSKILKEHKQFTNPMFCAQIYFTLFKDGKTFMEVYNLKYNQNLTAICFERANEIKNCPGVYARPIILWPKIFVPSEGKLLAFDRDEEEWSECMAIDDVNNLSDYAVGSLPVNG